MTGRHHHSDEPVRITTAPRSPAEERDHRQRRYAISMSIRTVCVILAAVFNSSWLMWVFIVGAVFMPYVAVIMANTANHKDEPLQLLDAPEHRGMLPPS